jgi:hypothetical protein
LRGQPVAALAAILGAWIMARVMTWSPLVTPMPPIGQQPPALADTELVETARPDPTARDQVDEPSHPQAALDRAPVALAQIAAVPVPSAAAPLPIKPPAVTGLEPVLILPSLREATSPAIKPSLPGPGRWSVDAWLFLRAGNEAALSGAVAPSYGASQAGGMVRYALLPGSARRLSAYLRASAAVDTKQREVAAGLSLRPLRRLPVALMAETRLIEDIDGRRVRPVVIAVTELPPFSLPAKMTAEVYAQGGYAAGREATPFGDGQVRVTRRLSERSGVHLDVGGGAWAGGQRGAVRVDVGPTASIAFPLGAGSLRLAADWRLRVAGDANPGSGPAMTISAGF